MDRTFNLNRFSKFLCKHFREHLRSYLTSLAVYGILILIIFFFVILFSHPRQLPATVQLMVWVISLYLGVVIFAGNIFSDYNHPRSSFSATLLPASILEKYVLYWLISLVGFFIVAFIVFQFSQWISLEYIKTHSNKVERLDIWNLGHQFPLLWFFLIFLLLHAISFLGSISFRKRTIITTAFITFLIFAAFTYLNLTFTNSFIGSRIPLPFISSTIPFGVNGDYVKVNQPNNELWGALTLFSLIVLIWICAFFKLKEREV